MSEDTEEMKAQMAVAQIIMEESRKADKHLDEK